MIILQRTKGILRNNSCKMKNYELILQFPVLRLKVSTVENSNSMPSKLDLTRLAQESDFPRLKDLFEFYGENCIAAWIPSDSSLSEVFKSQRETMLEFSDPLDLNYLYIISHYQTSSCLSKIFANFPIGVFRFNIQELFGRNTGLMVEYLIDIKRFKSSVYRQYIENQHCIKTCTSGISQARYLTDETNSSILDFTNTLERLRAQEAFALERESLECVICRYSLKSVVMIPCGHIVCCSDCSQKLPIGRKVVCPLCKCRVKSTQEVIF